MRNRLAVALGIVAAAVVVSVTAQSNVAGDWNMTIDSDQGSLSATMTFKQDGEKVTGSMPTDQITFEFEGTISDNKLELVAEIDAGGAFLEVILEATVDGDEITGTLDFGGYGSGDITATRIQ
jgi:hypothetical protein